MTASWSFASSLPLLPQSLHQCQRHCAPPLQRVTHRRRTFPRCSVSTTPPPPLHKNKTPRQKSSSGTTPTTRPEAPSTSKPAVSTHRSKLLDTLSEVSQRGIFGLQDDQRNNIDTLIQNLERAQQQQNSTTNLSQNLSGTWRVLYTTVEILGRRRVKLGIGRGGRGGLVKLGEIWQIIDWNGGKSKNIVEFSLMGSMKGSFEINADFQIMNKNDKDEDDRDGEMRNRVEVETRDWKLKPEKLMQLLGGEIGILMEVFNPQGWLDVTFVDERYRVGRDDKGNLFVLEKYEGQLPEALQGLQEQNGDAR